MLKFGSILFFRAPNIASLSAPVQIQPIGFSASHALKISANKRQKIQAGRARAASMTRAQRVALAKKAVNTRWGKRRLKLSDPVLEPGYFQHD